jgi:suppressor of G2 allele of SKP1
VAVKGVPRQPPVLFIETHDRISAEKSKWRVASMKLELTLVKEVPGKWADLGSQSSTLPGSVDVDANPWLAQWIDVGDLSAGAGSTVSEEPSRKAASSSDRPSEDATASEMNATTSGSSATTVPKAVATAKAPAYPTSSKSGPKDWDKIGADSDDESNDVDHFFKQLYKDSTPEQQRAMMKSYYESNGTALSTDWNEVSKGKVETNPPTGMEAKKWDA